jgi:hypothetical protein
MATGNSPPVCWLEVRRDSGSIPGSPLGSCPAKQLKQKNGHLERDIVTALHFNCCSTCESSGYLHSVVETSALPGCYAAYVGSFLTDV